jgi:hypothetical protein
VRAPEPGDPLDPDMGHETQATDHGIANHARLMHEVPGIARLRDERFAPAGHGRPPVSPAGVLNSGWRSSAVLEIVMHGWFWSMATSPYGFMKKPVAVPYRFGAIIQLFHA